MPELGASGSVRGALRNERPYRERRPSSQQRIIASCATAASTCYWAECSSRSMRTILNASFCSTTNLSLCQEKITASSALVG